jgi:hypothetical protein
MTWELWELGTPYTTHAKAGGEVPRGPRTIGARTFASTMSCSLEADVGTWMRSEENRHVLGLFRDRAALSEISDEGRSPGLAARQMSCRVFTPPKET